MGQGLEMCFGIGQLCECLKPATEENLVLLWKTPFMRRLCYDRVTRIVSLAIRNTVGPAPLRVFLVILASFFFFFIYLLYFYAWVVSPACISVHHLYAGCP